MKPAEVMHDFQFESAAVTPKDKFYNKIVEIPQIKNTGTARANTAAKAENKLDWPMPSFKAV